MAADKEKNMTADAKEFIGLLKNLNKSQKDTVKGIMIGMQMSREQLAVKSA